MCDYIYFLFGLGKEKIRKKYFGCRRFSPTHVPPVLVAVVITPQSMISVVVIGARSNTLAVLLYSSALKCVPVVVSRNRTPVSFVTV